MNKPYYIFTAGLLMLGCGQANTGGNSHKPEPDTATVVKADTSAALLTLADAEKILGEPARVSEDTSYKDGSEGIVRLSFAAKANNYK